MELAIPILAFVLANIAVRQSLGAGLAAAIGVGYFYGIVRANFPGVFATFVFDAAMLGLYLGFIASRRRDATARSFPPRLVNWCIALCLWPIALSIVPVNDRLVQLAALRPTIWFLPVILLGSQLTDADLRVVTRTLAGLNLVALCVGAYLYFAGIEALYPRNAATSIIYQSRDVAGGNYRIPATFLSSHAYGGTMLMSLALLLGNMTRSKVSRGEQALMVAGIVAAVGGIVMCGARQPVVAAVLVFGIAWLMSGFSRRLGGVIGVIVVASVALIAANERFQRILILEDTSFVEARIHGSMNEGFAVLLLKYPFGAGIGSAAGTSLPSFLSDLAPKQIGAENEYCRILVDQGWAGLALWLAFLGWMLWPPPKPQDWHQQGLTIVMMYGLILVTWATAFIGTGTLAGVPGSVILLAQMGVVITNRAKSLRTTEVKEFAFV